MSLPKPPTAANAFSLALSNNGAPPAFDALLAAVRQVLAADQSASPRRPPLRRWREA